MGWLSKTLGSIIDSIIEAKKDETEAYDSPATVLRDDGDILWVHIPGGVDETPIKKTIDAKRGDVIQVRVGGGTAWATGNQTAPPTDDTKAKEADSKARDANILAKLAKKTADKAGKTATNYLSWSAEYGLVVSEDATEDPEEMEGGSTRVTYDGVEMYKGQTRVAKFGEISVIGDEDSAHAYLDPDTFNITNEDGVQFFSVDMDGGTYSVYVTSTHGEGVVAPNTEVAITSDAAGLAQSGNSILVHHESMGGGFIENTTWFVYKGTPYSGSKTGSAGAVIRLDYDGDKTFTFLSNATVSRNTIVFITAEVTALAPSFSLGTRGAGEKGAFSAVIGEGLVAEYDNQVVFGKYNNNSVDNILEIGHGTPTNPQNILEVDQLGYLNCANHKDGINAAGSSNGWYYRKWANGFVECWTTTTITPSGANTATAKDLVLPMQLSTKYTMQATIQGIPEIATCHIGLTSASTSKIYLHIYASNTTTRTVNVYVAGIAS